MAAPSRPVTAAPVAAPDHPPMSPPTPAPTRPPVTARLVCSGVEQELEQIPRAMLQIKKRLVVTGN